MINHENNRKLDNSTIYIAVFIAHLTAIIAQGSLRVEPIELIMQIVFWGALLGFSLSVAWSYMKKDIANADDAKEDDDSQDKKQMLPEQLTNVTAVIGMLAFLFQVVSSNLTAGLLLLMSWLLIAQSFSLVRQRQLYFSLLISITLILYAASISKQGSFILYMVIFTLAAIITLASNFYLSQSSKQIDHTKLSKNFPFKLPITFLTATILVITSGIYLLVPRPEAMNWGSFPAGGGRYQASNEWPENSSESTTSEKNKDKTTQSKNQDSFEQENEQEIEQDNTRDNTRDNRNGEDVFYYSGFNDELKLNEQQSGEPDYNRLILYMEGKEPQYLRGNIYDYFDGLSWKTTHQTKQRLDRADNKFEINDDINGPFDQYTLTSAVHIAGKTNIFAPVSSAELQFPSNAIAKDNYGALFAPHTISKDTFYTVKVKQGGHKINGRPLDVANAPSKADRQRYTQLPKNISERFINFSKDLSKDGSDVMEKATMVEQHLRKNYEYSLESVFASQGKIPLEEFLFEKPLGHCEYFATAMVTLMRAQDIPARLVTGFSVTDYNPVTGYYEARGLDAHAWAEVWVPDTGWVTFEATPPYALPSESNAENTSQSIEEYLNKRAEDATLSDPESITTALLNMGKRAFEQFNILLKKTWSGLKTAIIWSGNMLLHYGWIGLLLLMIIYTLVHYLSYLLVHRKAKNNMLKAKGKSQQQQLKSSYHEMQRIFALYQHPRPEGWTLQQYQQYLGIHFPELQEEIDQISKALNTSLYNDQSDKTKALSSTSVTQVLNNTHTIITHKFSIPIPAEKQISGIRAFIHGLSFSKVKQQS